MLKISRIFLKTSILTFHSVSYDVLKGLVVSASNSLCVCVCVFDSCGMAVKGMGMLGVGVR